MTRLSGDVDSAAVWFGIDAVTGVEEGTTVGLGVGCRVETGSGTGVAEGVEAGSVEHATTTPILINTTMIKFRIRIDFNMNMRRRRPFRAPNQSRKLLPVKLRNTSSKVVESGSPTCDLRPRGVSRAISLPLSMIPMRSQRRSASSM